MTGPGKVSGGSESTSSLAGRDSSELPLLKPEVIAEGRRLLAATTGGPWLHHLSAEVDPNAAFIVWAYSHLAALLDAAEFGASA